MPTFIASVYGMNFEHMPELTSAIGYPLALVVMALSVLVLLPLLQAPRLDLSPVTLEPVTFPLAHVGGDLRAARGAAARSSPRSLYAKRARTLADRGKPVPVWRQVCFGGGPAR